MIVYSNLKWRKCIIFNSLPFSMLILLNSRKSLDDCDRFIIWDCLLYIYILWIHVVSKMSTQWYMISATIRQNMFYTTIKKCIFFKYIVQNKNIVFKNVYNFWVVEPYILYFSLIYSHSIARNWGPTYFRKPFAIYCRTNNLFTTNHLIDFNLKMKHFKF